MAKEQQGPEQEAREGRGQGGRTPGGLGGGHGSCLALGGELRDLGCAGLEMATQRV